MLHWLMGMPALDAEIPFRDRIRFCRNHAHYSVISHIKIKSAANSAIWACSQYSFQWSFSFLHLETCSLNAKVIIFSLLNTRTNKPSLLICLLPQYFPT